jgi:ABC transport system ATP-binding/permease protein
MAILASIQDLTKSFGSQELFKDVSFGISDGEQLGLIGPNGTGKSTLLKILAGSIDPDEGEVVLKKGTRLVYLAQKDIFDDEQTIQTCLEKSLEDLHLSDTDIHVKIKQAINQFGFPDSEQKVKELSGGWKKRLAICRCLLKEPDILLMDEPTNHLDIAGILWLESVIKNARFSFLVISHDRYFLEHCTNRIIELNPRYPGGYLKIEGHYSDFIEKREAFISEQAKKEVILSNKVRRETEWLRRGPKARTTKAKYRIDDAYRLQGELQEVKQRNRSNQAAGFDFESNDKKSKILLRAHHISKAYDEKSILNKFSLKLSPGMRIGLVGNNGSGKTTLMKMLSAELEPDEGNVKIAEGTRIVCFDQNRDQLNPDETLQDALSPSGSDSVIYREKSVHIVTWAKRFLFKVEQLKSPVSTLSGGEQARILISRLMLKPADVLILDEPTNDLDIPSLDVLENSLSEFPGAIILATHDRYLLERVSTHYLGFVGDGSVTAYADLDQCLKEQNQKTKKSKNKKEGKSQGKKSSTSNKLSFKDQYELDHIEENILKAEKSAETFREQIQDPKIIADTAKMTEACNNLEKAQGEVDHLYLRWGELEAKKN